MSCEKEIRMPYSEYEDMRKQIAGMTLDAQRMVDALKKRPGSIVLEWKVSDLEFPGDWDERYRKVVVPHILTRDEAFKDIQNQVKKLEAEIRDSKFQFSKLCEARADRAFADGVEKGAQSGSLSKRILRIAVALSMAVAAVYLLYKMTGV